MGKSSPSAPDTVGAARETGEQAFLLNEAQTAANRPNQYNPWGSTEWQSSQEWNPVTGSYQTVWDQVETLNPMLQQSLDAQLGVQAGRSELASGAMARAWEDYQNPMNFDQYGDVIGFNPEAGPQDFDYDIMGGRQAAEDAAYQRATQRLDPQFESRQASLETDLRNKGLRPGDQAYDAAMANFGRERNDAYEMARLGAVGEGRQESQLSFGQGLSAAELNAQLQGQRFGQGAQANQIANALRQQQIMEDLYRRDFNLSEVDRLLQGQMVQGGPPSSGGQTESSGGGNTVAGYLTGE